MTKKNDLVLVDDKYLKDKIYIIRGQKVMLDKDLAEIYGYTTKAFNRQIKNNISKFDVDFMLALTKEESLRCNFCTSKNKGRGGNRYTSYAFTEKGVYMLMTVLKGPLATKQSRALIRLFKSMGGDTMSDYEILIIVLTILGLMIALIKK